MPTRGSIAGALAVGRGPTLQLAEDDRMDEAPAGVDQGEGRDAAVRLRAGGSTGGRRMGVRTRTWILACLLAGCEPSPPAPSPVDQVAEPSSDTAQTRVAVIETPAVDLIDPSIAPAIAGENGWNFVQRAEGDFDQDGQAELLVLTARVELYQGRPAWDDGQPWQVYIEEPDSTRTYLFARYVQLGTLTMRVGVAEGDRGPTAIVLEHLPDRLSLYEVRYIAPDSVISIVRFQRTVDPRGELASPALP